MKLLYSLQDELRARSAVPDKLWEQLRGSLKTDDPSSTHEEIEAILEQRQEEKYLECGYCWTLIFY